MRMAAVGALREVMREGMAMEREEATGGRRARRAAARRVASNVGRSALTGRVLAAAARQGGRMSRQCMPRQVGRMLR